MSMERETTTNAAVEHASGQRRDGLHSIEEPFCLTFSFNGKHSWLIYADDKEGLRMFRQWLERARPRIILHNAVWDARVLKTMGIDVWQYEITDTMVNAYVLQDIPRGL